MKTFMMSLAGTTAALAAAAPAAAQPQAGACAPAGADFRIAFGECRRSSLGAGDRTADELPYEDWRIRLEAGRPVQIEMDAVPPSGEADAMGFDTYLELRRAGSDDVLESNDDRPGSLNSRIPFTPAEGGDYVVRARPLASREGGDYVLRVGAAPPPPVRVPLADGRTSGRVDSRTPLSESMDGFRTSLYSFAGAAGERVSVTLRSAAPNMMMNLADESARVIAFGEASEGEARLVAILPAAGRYLLEVALPDQAEAIPYTIELARRTAVAPRPPRPLAVGGAAAGELGLDSPAVADPYGEGTMALAETYRLPVRAGAPVTVTLESDAFDAVLEAGGDTPLGFAAAQTNDDYGDGLNSRLVLRPERTGTVILRVRALGQGTGAYRIRVEPGAAAPIEGGDEEGCHGHH